MLLLIIFAGCNEILEDVEPPTSVSGELVLTTEDGVNALRSRLYSIMRANSGFTTQYMVAPSAFTDETRARTGATRYVNLNVAVGTSGTAHISAAGAVYGLINVANHIISGVEDGVVPAEVLNRYRGEAYALRAFAMHTLVRAWGYEPGNYGQGPESNWDKGIIIRTEPTLDVADADNRPRSSVEEAYAQIIQDLEQARTLLAGYNDNNTYVTEAFAVGLLARVHLYAGNWAEAASLAQEAINISGRTLETSESGVAGMFFETQGGHPEALFKIVVDPNTEPIAGSNVNEGLAAFTSSQWVSQVPTQKVLDLYNVGDYRREHWYQPCFNSQQGTPVGGCEDVNEPGVSTNKWNGDKGNLADDIPYMRVAELYLIWAEAAAKAANNPSAGAEPLQTLKDARNAGSIPSEALASMQAFEDEILNERIRELIVEGHRFWDLKRLGRDVRHPDGSIKMFADSYRILAPIGTNARDVNPLLEENPVYN